MFKNTIRCVITAVGLVLLCALPAAANTLRLSVTASCGCEYSVTVSGFGVPNSSVTITYSFNEIVNGISYPVSGQIVTNTDAAGNYGPLTVSGKVLPGGCAGSVVEFSPIEAVAVSGADRDEFNFPGPVTMDCTTPPPPPGKPFDIGPSSMEGHLLIRPGDFISGGYSFKFVSGSHPPEAVTVTSSLTLPFKCPQGGGPGGDIVINLGTQTINVPANNTDWQPTGDANSVLSWAGVGVAPDGCSGQVMDNSKGAIFNATVSQSPDTGQLLNWRFKYRDPNAKGKGNVNCLDTSDPRRAKADVCGASWSQTVRDP